MNRPDETRARVLLVDDDSATRLFVEMALSDFDIDFSCAGSVREATDAMRASSPALVIVDLMLPGDSGLSLLASMQSDRQGLGRARSIVASAAVDAPGMRERLQGLGVWQVLCKPLTLAVLESNVAAALRLPPRSAEAVLPGPALSPPSAADRFFGGDTALYRAYLESCLPQFVHDIAAGDEAVRVADLAALRRLGHNLTSVMQTLGQPPAMHCAEDLERDAQLGDRAAAAMRWAALRAALLEITSPH